jgi:hypothetical protein
MAHVWCWKLELTYRAHFPFPDSLQLIMRRNVSFQTYNYIASSQVTSPLRFVLKENRRNLKHFRKQCAFSTMQNIQNMLISVHWHATNLKNSSENSMQENARTQPRWRRVREWAPPLCLQFISPRFWEPQGWVPEYKREFWCRIQFSKCLASCHERQVLYKYSQYVHKLDVSGYLHTLAALPSRN